MTRPIIRLKTNVASAERVKTEPIDPITPPNMKKEIMRPPWNIICGLILSPSFANVADIDRTSPPTTAMQVESEAIIPITNDVP